MDIDDGNPPPELLGADPHLKAIIKMLQDHRREAMFKILSLHRYLLNEMKGHSDETLQAFQWERGQRENALMLLWEQNEKEIAVLWEKNKKEIANRQAALMSIWEGIAKDIADTHRANNKLSANLASIKHMMDTNPKKNQSTFDKIAENQSIFQATTNGTLATIVTTVSSITQSTTDSVEAAVTGVTKLMVKEISNIANAIARVEGDMTVLRNLVTLVQTTQVDAPTVPTKTGLTECSDNDGNPPNLPPGTGLLSLQDILDSEDAPPGPSHGLASLSLQERIQILDDADVRPHDATRGPSPGFRSLQDRMNARDNLDDADGRPHDATRGPSPGFWSLQERRHANDTTYGWSTPVRGPTSNDTGAPAAHQAPSALHGQLMSPLDPSSFVGSGLGTNNPTKAPKPGMPIPNDGSTDWNGGVASSASAPAADVPDFKLNGYFGSGFGQPDASRDAWAASARQRESLAATGSGTTPHMDLHRPIGITVGDHHSMKNGLCQDDQAPAQPSRGEYQNSPGYDMASGYTRPYHPDEELAGGCISSPCHADHKRQAMENRVSPLDIAGLGDKQYHGGDGGYVPLIMHLVHQCSYTKLSSSDVIASYQTIIHVHDYVLDKWEDQYQNCGPQVDKILEKGLPTFP